MNSIIEILYFEQVYFLRFVAYQKKRDDSTFPYHSCYKFVDTLRRPCFSHTFPLLWSASARVT